MSTYCKIQAVYTNSLFTVDCTLGACVVAAGTVLIAVVVGTTGTFVVVGTTGTGTVGVVGRGAGVGIVGVGGGGPSIVVGPPTGPEQIFPSSQHPIMPLLASAQ